MATPATDLLEIILRECAGARPEPWYPADYARVTGLARESLDEPLDELRLAGLVRLTDWVQGKGQGYTVTPAGESVLQRPRLLGRLRGGAVPQMEEAPPALTQPEEKPPGWERARLIRDALISPTRPVVTLGLILINLVMFLMGLSMAQQRGVASTFLGLSAPLGQGPIAGGAVQPFRQVNEIQHELGSLSRLDLVGGGQWWRLLTTAFLHGGLIHLALNMYFLYSVGPLLERMLGSLRYLILYLSAAVTGSCVAVIYMPDPTTVMVGASTALCGLLAAMATWVYLNHPYLPRDLAGSWMRGILTNVILIVFISLLPGVSASGHFGGGVGGLIAAAPLTASRYGRGPQRWLGLVGALLVPAVAILWVERSVAAEGQAPRVAVQVQRLVAQAKKVGQGFYAKEVQPLCVQARQGKAPAAEKVARARQAAASAQQLLARIDHALPVADSLDDARVQAAVGFAHEYITAWRELFADFQGALADAKGLTGEEAVALLQRRGLVDRAQEKLNASILAGK